MITEKVIVTQIKITKARQIKHFQIMIPRNAKHIIGIETCLRMISPFEQNVALLPFYKRVGIKRDRLVGELKLQSCEEANIFYSNEIHERDSNLPFGDFSEKESFRVKDWTHSLRHEVEVVTVDGDTTILSGVYRDRIGEAVAQDIQYEVKIHVWYEIEQL